MVAVRHESGKKAWDRDKVFRTIEKLIKKDVYKINELVDQVEKEVMDLDKEVIAQEEISNIISKVLMGEDKDIAIYYTKESARKELTSGREIKGLPSLSAEFLESYATRDLHLDPMGHAIYLRSYSRFLEDKKRRENYWETVARAVDYSISLADTEPHEAEELFDLVYNNKIFLSGRTLYSGGTDITSEYPTVNFNCSFTIGDELESFTDLFYLLMIGSGVGFRILPEDVAKMPKVRTDYEVVMEDYSARPADKRVDHTQLIFPNNTTAIIGVGDSKEGWVHSLGYYLELITSFKYKNITTIRFNFNHVRKKGERLKRFGGTSSGHESLKKMFSKITTLITSNYPKTDKYKLKTIDCMDIANIIGENVVSGGVRRTAEIMMIDPSDKECIQAKNDLYKQVDGKWILNEKLSHRQVSNNSVVYFEKPTREQMHWQIDQMRNSGEPAFINAEEAKRRKPNFHGVNPCGEILLDKRGLCNLTSLNVPKFIEDGKLDKDALLRGQRHSARVGYRLTCPKLELHKWNKKHKEDVIVGCSLSGWQDAMNILGYTMDEQRQLLRELREAAHEAVESYAKQLGGEEATLVTSVKPEGTQSQVAGDSSGLHFAHSPYYIRRVRISDDDPLFKLMDHVGFKNHPETGQTEENAITRVLEFPVKAPKGKTKYDVSAIEQLEIYKMFMEEYVDHNASITVHVRDHEWEQVEEWMWENWDTVVGVTFISLSDHYFDLMPYEEIDEETYNKLKDEQPILPVSLLPRFEKDREGEIELDASDCESGVCPIR